LTECELPAIGTAAEGLVAAGPYFRGIEGWPGKGRFGSSHEAAAYVAVRGLARLLAHRPGAEHLSLSQLLAEVGTQGGIIDPETHHTVLPALIARVEGGAFRLVHRGEAVAGDPYLTRSSQTPAKPQLRVVS
jgi:branched-chain amino acid transport system substrate-binding protein